MASNPDYSSNFDPDERELALVFDTEDESEAMVVKGLLESEGIPALVTSLDAQQNLLPGVGGVVVRVPADRAEDAKQLIAENRGTAPPEDGNAEGGPQEVA